MNCPEGKIGGASRKRFLATSTAIDERGKKRKAPPEKRKIGLGETTSDNLLAAKNIRSSSWKEDGKNGVGMYWEKGGRAERENGGGGVGGGGKCAETSKKVAT